MIGEDIYNGLYANEEFRGTIKTAQDVTVECLCAGFDQGVDNSVLGQAITNVAEIHVLASNEPEKKLAINDKITFTDADANEYKARIAGRANKSGLITLTVEAVNQ